MNRCQNLLSCVHQQTGIFTIGYSIAKEEYGLALTAFIGCTGCIGCTGLLTVQICTVNKPVVNSKQEVLGCPKSGPREERVVKKVFLLTYYIS